MPDLAANIRTTLPLLAAIVSTPRVGSTSIFSATRHGLSEKVTLPSTVHL